ncbi:MAG: uncharacterized protein KVP18_000564 [Porospora cf. gigantea A]|uniref:uncharacterized protein n=1 Tax=Porospora cf. gigantea A TaxID=2853593 RepID=UPI0035595315|nr:MAG: hypothetical protein KVP18_000564 [Porospora cf. gigantea A]
MLRAPLKRLSIAEDTLNRDPPILTKTPRLAYRRRSGHPWGRIGEQLSGSVRSPPQVPSIAVSTDDGQPLEKAIVDGVMRPGGVRLSISNQAVREFLDQVRSVDQKTVAKLLFENLKVGSRIVWYVDVQPPAFLAASCITDTSGSPLRSYGIPRRPHQRRQRTQTRLGCHK